MSHCADQQAPQPRVALARGQCGTRVMADGLLIFSSPFEKQIYFDFSAMSMWGGVCECRRHLSPEDHVRFPGTGRTIVPAGVDAGN